MYKSSCKMIYPYCVKQKCTVVYFQHNSCNLCLKKKKMGRGQTSYSPGLILLSYYDGVDMYTYTYVLYRPPSSFQLGQ